MRQILTKVLAILVIAVGAVMLRVRPATAAPSGLECPKDWTCCFTQYCFVGCGPHAVAHCEGHFCTCDSW